MAVPRRGPSLITLKIQITHFYFLLLKLSATTETVSTTVRVETVETHWFRRETRATATRRDIDNDSFCPTVHSMFFCPLVTINFFFPLSANIYRLSLQKGSSNIYFFPDGDKYLSSSSFDATSDIPWGQGLTHSPWEIRINFQVGRAESKNDSFCLPLKLRPRHLLIFIEADPAQSLPPPLFFLAHLLHLQL